MLLKLWTFLLGWGGGCWSTLSTPLATGLYVSEVSFEARDVIFPTTHKRKNLAVSTLLSHYRTELSSVLIQRRRSDLKSGGTEKFRLAPSALATCMAP